MQINQAVFKALLFRSLPLLVGLASLSEAVGLPSPARADVPLTRADVESLLNRVEMLPRGGGVRPARLSDFLGLGDALRTASSSRAELRFNDGSLARVGERATFQFVPNTRNFRLSNGTVLLLIPPGQGRTTIQTPSAVTGIQGSGVVVRHIPSTDTTAIMALTQNSTGPILVTLPCTGQRYGLNAGQMALIQDCEVKILSFDLRTFYETSDLVKDLHLDDPTYEGLDGDPINLVRQETLQALANQGVFEAEAVIDPRLFSVADPTLRQAVLPSEEGPILRDLSSGLSGYSSVTATGRIVQPEIGIPNPGAAPAPGGTPSMPNPGMENPAVTPSPPINPGDPGTTPGTGGGDFPDKGDLSGNTSNPGGITGPSIDGGGLGNPSTGIDSPGGMPDSGPGVGSTPTDSIVGGNTGNPNLDGGLPGVGNGAINPSDGGGNPAAGGVVPGNGIPAGGANPLPDVGAGIDLSPAAGQDAFPDKATVGN